MSAPASACAPELARIDAMAEDGVVSREGFRIIVPYSARPFLRSVCAVFDRYLSSEAARHSRAF
jgi:oxygen-independent coproporphyrinogen-3 oxidase